ncbi:alpha/beta fold hydrolase [Agromyces bauzanensis]|uniref:Alpha/beta hydrolase n=1 Tax=Agromyces bauzanensis TaxID=1308924 RepID=A0A917USU2_9MICO|nr:alpha/beta hydrolase [Agromyces bauzanensis]GGJ83361.1 alpha/beta hydrolase [Agromyces bauzanensis]
MSDGSTSRTDRGQLIPTRAGNVFVSVDEGDDDRLTLVLLPSGGHSRHDWDAVRPILAAHSRTAALDWPGHGDSPPPDSHWMADSDGFADVVEDVVDAVTGGPVALVGNSVGGFAAARFALRHPERTRALILVDTGGFIPITLKVRLFDWAMGHPRFLRAIYPRFAHWYVRADTPEARTAEQTAVAIATKPGVSELLSVLWRGFSEPSASLLGEVEQITAPTLVVWGARDPVIPVSAGRELAARLTDAHLSVLDTGHVPAASRPAEFLEAVLPFLLGVAEARR